MEKVTLTNLTNATVTVKREQVDEQGQQIGPTQVSSYMNSVVRRDRINDLEEPYRTAVLEIWGDNPIIDDSEPE